MARTVASGGGFRCLRTERGGGRGDPPRVRPDAVERGLEQVFGQHRPLADYRPKQVFDIEAETVFTDAEGYSFTVKELTDYIAFESRGGARPRVMITGSFTGDTASKGSNRCLCSIGRYGLTIWDSKTNISHHLVSAKPIEDGVIANILKKIAERARG
jgi:hypothetical protein